MKLTIMKKKIEIQVPEGKVAEWKEINGVTTLVLVDEVDNRPITERIKTFEDARDELGDEHPLVKEYWGVININLDIKQDLISYLKLRIICAALNEGWEPQFTTDEYRHYPWFYLYTQEEIDNMDEEKKKSLWLFGGNSGNVSNCGLACAYSNDAWSISYSYFSARLAVKSEALARYFGQQFIDIWSDYVCPFNCKQADLLRREENTSKH